MGVLKRILFIFLVTVIITPSVEAQWRKKKRKNKEKQKTEVQEGVVSKEPGHLSSDIEVKTSSMFIEGMGKFVGEDYEDALDIFLKCDDVLQNEPAVKYQIAETYFHLGQTDKALPYALKALNLDNQNRYYYQLVAQIYIDNNQLEKALSIYDKLNEAVGDDIDAYYEKAAIYLQLGQPQEAITAYNHIEDKFGLDEMVIRQKQKIYIRMNDLDAAIIEGKKLTEAYPNIIEFKYSQIKLLIGNNRTDQAADMLAPLLEELPDNGQLHFLNANILRIQGNEEESLKELEIAFKSTDLHPAEKLDILGGYLQFIYNEQKLIEGLKLSKLAVETHPENAKINTMAGDFLLRQKQLKEARKYYEKAIQLDGDNYNVWQQLITIDWDLNDMESLMHHTEDALELFPNQVNLYLYNGTAFYMNEMYLEAEAILEQGLSLAIDNATKSQFHAQLGDVYHQLEKHEKSDKAFEEILKFDPNNPHALNNYSYFLSIRKQKLNKAKEMASKLVKMHPDDATYLDTYGWVLYTLGEYEEAEKILKKASDKSKDATTLEHYGDVLFQLGKKEQAVSQWQKASLAQGEHSKILKQKLAEKRLIE